MGAKSKRRKAFLAQHPLCCFCGGSSPSEEIDHVPSRVLFKDRQWPEGYEFPACSRCNRATALDEQVVAMLSLVSTSTADPSLATLAQERMQAVANNLPAVFKEMRPTTSQLREAGRKYGIRPAPGQALRDLPLLSVRGPLVNAAITNFGRKLACALFYNHTGAVAPPDADIAVRWYSNLQLMNDEIPQELAGLLVNFPELRRAKSDLQDQFLYRWAVSDTGRMYVFLAMFREAFAILAFVNASEANRGTPEGATVLRPNAWAKPLAGADPLRPNVRPK